MGLMRTPEEVREYARTHEMATTAGHARGFMQANLLAVPQEYAFDFLLFAQRNPKPCPIVGVLEAGQYTSELLPGGDIRTDIPAYRVFENGEHTATLADATSYYTPDMVSFLIGCSFTFETALQDNGIEVAHIAQQRNVPMFKTTIPTTPAGVFSGPMVVPRARFRPRKSPMRCGLPPVTHQFTAPRSTWVTRRPLVLRICPARTLVIRAKCRRAACRSFGPVV